MGEKHVQWLITFVLISLALVMVGALIQHKLLPWVWPEGYAQIGSNLWFLLMLIPARWLTMAIFK